ncbi:MAG: hypothetical protein GXP52_06275 [Deltaproteobacteria bacterium]|nr:hypothetical protein [Deltaproteobacteria bacterium]
MGSLRSFGKLRMVSLSNRWRGRVSMEFYTGSVTGLRDALPELGDGRARRKR